MSRHSYHTLSLFKIQHVCYNNFKPGVITPQYHKEASGLTKIYHAGGGVRKKK